MSVSLQQKLLTAQSVAHLQGGVLGPLQTVFIELSETVASHEQLAVIKKQRAASKCAIIHNFDNHYK